MPIKKIVHDMAKSIAEKTAPDYVPPRKPLTPVEKQRLIKVKANLEASVRKLAQLVEFLQTTQKELGGYRIPQVDLESLTKQLKVQQRELTQQLERVQAVIVAGGIPIVEPAPPAS